MKINEVANLTGLTVRTLHYYDKIGLLKPSEITESGYRLYYEDALETLQQILFFRELEFPLKEIKQIMTNPNYNKEKALDGHLELLMEKRKRLDQLIELVNSKRKGEKNMSFREFDTSEIEEIKKKYAKEVEERFGDTDSYLESQKRTSSYSETQWETIQRERDAIFQSFSDCRGSAPNSKEIQSLVKKWQDHITTYFYPCSDEILSGLGHMYIEDERFTKNIDQYGEGTAALIEKAITVYCEQKNGNFK